MPPGLRSGTGLLSFIAGAAAVRCSPFQSHDSRLDLGLSRCPLFDSRLASRRLALVCKLPLILSDLRRLSRTNQYPLAADLLRQAPTSIGFRSLLNTLLVAFFGPVFRQLSSRSLRSASISRLESFDMSLTTLFSLTQAGVVQLPARSASYPCLFLSLRQCSLAAAYPAPGSYTVLVALTFFSECVSRIPASSILLTSPPVV